MQSTGSVVLQRTNQGLFPCRLVISSECFQMCCLGEHWRADNDHLKLKIIPPQKYAGHELTFGSKCYLNKVPLSARSRSLKYLITKTQL